MNEQDETGWLTILGVMGVMSLLVLALFYFPELRPDAAVLECDRKGGFWSSETGSCEVTDSPAAGLAA